MQLIDKNTSPHYSWAEGAFSWVFLDSQNLSIKLETMMSGTKEKRHFHAKAQQFFFILNGTAKFYLTNETVSVQQKQGLLILPGNEHYIANETGLELEFLVISEPSTDHDRINLE